jgi:hypothetical protein
MTERLNRFDYEKAVFASKLSDKGKVVALAYCSFGDQTVSPVWPGVVKIGEMADMNKDTANYYRQELVEQGWLEPGERTKDGGTKYWLTAGNPEPTGNRLGRSTKRMNAASLANLKQNQPDLSETSVTSSDSIGQANLSETSEGPFRNFGKSLSETSEAASPNGSEGTTIEQYIKEQPIEEPSGAPTAAGNLQEKDTDMNTSDSSLESDKTAARSARVVSRVMFKEHPYLSSFSFLDREADGTSAKEDVENIEETEKVKGLELQTPVGSALAKREMTRLESERVRVIFEAEFVDPDDDDFYGDVSPAGQAQIRAWRKKLAEQLTEGMCAVELAQEIVRKKVAA